MPRNKIYKFDIVKGNKSLDKQFISALHQSGNL